jgi:argininosuccinate lyase
MWFSAYAETLIDDITMLNAALKVDQNPLGSPQVTAAPSLLIEHLPPKN